MRFAFTGPFFSGKTSLAKYLRHNYEFEVINYTDHLKELAHRGFVAMGKDITYQDIVNNKEKYRSYLQNLGECLEFDQGWHVEELCNYKLWNLGFNYNYVFDNVRFIKQYEKLIKYNFILVRVQCSVDTQAERALKLGVSSKKLHMWLDHPAEKGIPTQDNEITLNSDNNSIENLAKILIEDYNARNEIH